MREGWIVLMAWHDDDDDDDDDVCFYREKRWVLHLLEREKGGFY